MPLSWNEIRSRATQFSKNWATESSEEAEAKPFWIEFFEIFGLSRKRLASFEEPVKKLGDNRGYIDLFWKGVLLVEHKSRGKSLEKAYTQALDYFPGILERDLPKYILVSDFARLRLYDLEAIEEPFFHEFPLEELPQHIHLFGFMAGYQVHKFKEQDPVNVQAAELMGQLHDQLLESGYTGHELELYLVRLLFCLFAEDTAIFEPQQFQLLIEQRTKEDGSDLGSWLGYLFEILNRPGGKRQKILDEQLAAFPYVNGKLFTELLFTASFNRPMRQTLLEACALDWSKISPAIFGSLFQSIMDKEARRNLGAHYTSEKNILKVLKPLFLDELWAEFEKIKQNKNRLTEFHKKIRSLKFLDPACGCGNFLVVAYHELRELELAVLKALYPNQISLGLDVSALVQVNVDQFFGIEIEEFPAQIAQVALWLVDHQMNLRVSQQFGQYFTRIPLQTAGNIIHGNALELDWQEIIPSSELHYIMGNPPFSGKKEQSSKQKQEVLDCFKGIKDAGVLDYVACWYVKAVQMMSVNKQIRSAFVSTNSITQGEQVKPLWQRILDGGLCIQFAHRTFKWSNEARGKAAVHVVIIGFGYEALKNRDLFVYTDISGEPVQTAAANISPYLIDYSNILIGNRSTPISDVPQMIEGITPLDKGVMSAWTEEQYLSFIAQEPAAEKWFKKWVTGHSYINGYNLYCLWMSQITPAQLRQMPTVEALVKKVELFRKESRSSQQFAPTSWLFRETTIPPKYILIPKSSSETRDYVPFGIVEGDIASSSCLMLLSDDLFYLGVLLSKMHMVWLKTVGGKLKSDYRYSAKLVYNNFPWPLSPTAKQKQAIEEAVTKILEARTSFPDSTLADLYKYMPKPLLKAHQKLDKAVDRAYGKTDFKSEAERVAFLFELYQRYTSLFPAEKPTKRRKAK